MREGRGRGITHRKKGNRKQLACRDRRRSDTPSFEVEQSPLSPQRLLFVYVNQSAAPFSLINVDHSTAEQSKISRLSTDSVALLSPEDCRSRISRAVLAELNQRKLATII